VGRGAALRTHAWVFSIESNPCFADRREQRPHLARFAPMFPSRSLDDLHYYKDRVEHCRQAAAEATDPSVRVAHQQLAKFYEARLASAMESAALRSGSEG